MDTDTAQTKAGVHAVDVQKSLDRDPYLETFQTEIQRR